MATFTGAFGDVLPVWARTPGTAIVNAAAQMATQREAERKMLFDILKLTPNRTFVPRFLAKWFRLYRFGVEEFMRFAHLTGTIEEPLLHRADCYNFSVSQQLRLAVQFPNQLATNYSNRRTADRI